MQLLKCSDCLEDKDETAFYPGPQKTRGGRRYTCKPCDTKKTYAWRKTEKGGASYRASKHRYKVSTRGRAKNREFMARPEKRKRNKDRGRERRASIVGRAAMFDFHLLRRYGIDAEDWARMFNEQACGCAACGKRLTYDRYTHVDHCHKTGKVRALLCQFCNTALGLIGDSSDRLFQLMVYLEKHSD